MAPDKKEKKRKGTGYSVRGFWSILNSLTPVEQRPL